MLRMKLIKHLAQAHFVNNKPFMKTNTKLSIACQCQFMSNVNTARKDKFASSLTNRQDEPYKKFDGLENKRVTDKEYFVQLKNNPDKFGPAQRNEVLDEGDLKEEQFFTEQPLPSRKLRTKQYADIIKSLIRHHKIKEAIDVVEVRMLKEDRVKPENYVFNLLLGACGKVGYTKKAFSLYNNMKKRGLKVTGGTYTALFNACANSPWPLDGLERAKHLRNIMIEKGYEPNDTNYNAMIKAFGRCGDLPMAFMLVDEMSSKGFKIKDDTINFLLQACITDKEAGFRHALLVWRKLVKKNISPTLYTYNLMLRCIRDCGLGDIEVTEHVINKILSENDVTVKKLKVDDKLLLQESTTVRIEGHDSKNDEISIQQSNENDIAKQYVKNAALQTSDLNSKVKDLRPNLMAKIPHLGSIISLSEVKKPEERLLLVGGCSGFLENMKQNQCTPDIKTFTQLLDNIPSSLAAEKELLSAMRKLNVKVDIDFYNMLIKKRSMRFDFTSAKEVLQSMKQQKMIPNLLTYGVLALGCKDRTEALELIKEMESKSYRLNIQILGAMLHQACHHRNTKYILEIMEKCVKDGIPVDKKFVSTIQNFIKTYRKELRSKESTKSERTNFAALKARYESWCQEVQMDETEDVHPWQQFKEEIPQDVHHFRWKDGARFKPRHTSRFRVKTCSKRESIR